MMYLVKFKGFWKPSSAPWIIQGHDVDHVICCVKIRLAKLGTFWSKKDFELIKLKTNDDIFQIGDYL